MTESRERARVAKSAAHREMREAATREIRTRSLSLGEAMEAARTGETAIIDTTSLAQLSAVVLLRSMHLLDGFAHDTEQEPSFRANCARNNGELALKLADHLVNARPERDAGASSVRVVVMQPAELDALEREQRASLGAG